MEQAYKLELERFREGFEAHGFTLYKIGLYEFRLLNKVSAASLKLVLKANRRWALQYTGDKNAPVYKLAKSIFICAAGGKTLKVG
ncbi:MAG: hypothetical protein F6K45_20620 [Kamptonema sp. SIO1D9]|nr:hypothetical protein [Kamptonema sp. SIO1D9]